MPGVRRNTSQWEQEIKRGEGSLVMEGVNQFFNGHSECCCLPDFGNQVLASEDNQHC